ncbi:hypothetical protein O1611_g6770 [Lasiodiplodia mahajangana]|uniref:Uncharacterized protein n=1 Tax=Lasiodiplodia mahajangana TaxID=1108764 RepID=A0ACC2JHZ5_9PEZI|nr:hypothetical protein O1611_g6770 [Lasiodiplodia mahajangana]
MWTITIGKAKQAAARFFPDIEPLDIGDTTRLACLAFLVLHREKALSEVRSSNEDVQGLVLQLVDDALDTYERVGYFTTSYVPKSRVATQGRKALMGAQVKTLRLTGWTSEAYTEIIRAGRI